MKVNRSCTFLEKGTKEDLILFKDAEAEVLAAIKTVVWPLKAPSFVINPRRKENGVVPIKSEFISYLKSKDWITEKSFALVNGIGPGPIDAVKDTESGRIAVEWETGNISSSHRAINKMATALLENNIIAGILVIPIRDLAKYLTDRIGNYEEIEPYFSMWQSLNIQRGMLAIIGIEQDGVSTKVPFIPKGKDGNSRKRPGYPKSSFI